MVNLWRHLQLMNEKFIFHALVCRDINLVSVSVFGCHRYLCHDEYERNAFYPITIKSEVEK